MKHVKEYLDSTYLKRPADSGLSEEATGKEVEKLLDDALAHDMKLVMIRPEYVKFARKKIDEAAGKVLVGTVIDFPEGNRGLDAKMKEALQAIEDGADELDFVADYHAYKEGHTEKVKNEFVTCTAACLNAGKTAKWIIEAAALTDDEIASICTDLHKWSEIFPAETHSRIFLKSSTGFYKTENGAPNGATPENIFIMKANAGDLPVKAAGGVRNYEEAVRMIELGVSRIGTSSAMAILKGEEGSAEY